LAMGGSGEDTVKPYPVVEDLVRPVQRVGMPRAPRVVAPAAPSMSWRMAGDWKTAGS
jgi:hypothetical protein